MEVPYERRPRTGGESHFPLLGSLGPISTFANATTSLSHVPLVFLLLLGLAGGAPSLLALAVLGTARVLGAGTPTRATFVLFGVLLWSTLAVGIGMLGLYLARIHREVLGRPRYIVESPVEFDPPR